MKGKSFALDPLEEEQSVFSEAKINGEIWHKRVGHFNHTSVVDLQRKELVQGLPQLEAKIPNCKTCQQGKQSRLPFKNATWRAVEKLQLIHTDVAGPHRTPSLKGSRYFLILLMTTLGCVGYISLNSSQKLLGCFGNSRIWLKLKVAKPFKL